MKLLTKAPRGTQDILPKDSYKWRFLENIMLEQAKIFGFSEIRTPTFEHTELFSRSVGEDTDVVQKEMYTFLDKGNRSITLRPEGTAGVVRAVLEHGLFNEALPLKLSYVTSCYRYEKPQSGRFREFEQFGSEMFGSDSPAADAEIIMLASSIFSRLGLKNIILEINSIGCKNCRKNYYMALKSYLNKHKENLCDTCKSRLDKNPMRILDCKCSSCKKIAETAPNILEFICNDCQTHFEEVKSYLNAAEVCYVVNPTIVRGLDYYTKTVFEFVCHNENNSSLVCGGGGRYNGLVEELGGNPLPALGFGLGIERILVVMQEQNIEISPPNTCDVYLAAIGNLAYKKAFVLSNQLREASINSDFDSMQRSLKAQLKFADKIGARFIIVLGDDEVTSGVAKIKDMATGEQQDISLNENFLQDFFKVLMEQESKSLFNNLKK